jgi:hypothetical protein
MEPDRNTPLIGLMVGVRMHNRKKSNLEAWFLGIFWPKTSLCLLGASFQHTKMLKTPAVARDASQKKEVFTVISGCADLSFENNKSLGVFIFRILKKVRRV